MKDDGSVGTEMIDLGVDGVPVRVVVDDPRLAADVREALADFLSDEPGQIGFALQSPSPSRRLHVLLDRSGMVLGRFRHPADGVRVLARHLDAFRPPPDGATRLRVRSLIGADGSAVLALFPLFSDPPIVERRIAKEHFRIVDRLVTDVGPDVTLRHRGSPWADDDIEAHVAAPDGAPVGSVLVPALGASVSLASSVASIASAGTVDASPARRLDLAEQLAPLVTRVELEERSARYAALRRASATESD